MSTSLEVASIRIIGISGKEGRGENQFAQPRGICIDSRTKEIFIVDCNNHRVQVFHLSSLAFIRQIGRGIQGSTNGSLNYAVGICMDDANQIFVADTNNHRIVVFNHITGVHIRSIGTQGSQEGMLNSPYGVCVDHTTGLLYVADYDNNRVQVFDKETGHFVKIIGTVVGPEPSQMNQPIVVRIDYDTGYLFVADYSNNRVLVLDKDSGAFIASIGANGGPDALNGPRGLCISNECGLLFVSDRENHRIQMYNKHDFSFIRHLGNGIGTNPGQFNRPMEMCINLEDGVLLVVDGYNHRVQIIEIPELQVEKNKLRAAAKAKLDAEMNGKPKPSLIAVTTNISEQDELYLNPLNGTVTIRFNSFGPLFDVHIPKRDIHLLNEYCVSLGIESPYKISKSDVNLTKQNYYFKENFLVPNENELMHIKKQSNIFLSILDSLSSTLNSEENIPYSYVVPPLFALHSLIDRKWEPDNMPTTVIYLLMKLMCNVNQGAANESEKSRVMDAIVAIVCASLNISSELVDCVLNAVLENLGQGLKYYLIDNSSSTEVCNMKELENNKNKDFENDSTGESYLVMLAYFDILGAIFEKENMKLSFHERVSESKNILQSSSIDLRNRNCMHSNPETYKTKSFDKKKTMNYLSNGLLTFIYGTSMISSLDSMRQNQFNREQLLNGGASDKSSNKSNKLAISKSQSFSSINVNGSSSNPKVESNTDTEAYVPREICPLIQTVFRINKIRQSTQIPSANPLYNDLQCQLFDNAKTYLIELHNHEIEKGFHNVDKTKRDSEKRSRGGRNIWRLDEPLAVGDLADCMDKEKCWFESVIQEIATDGSIKVHFMGWGSKWDDIITAAEISTRLAPLNTKTKNWRADLFEGGLIEIKCNDDLINQKWMWGKIVTLNTAEAWVEVSYSFSNEPTVIKRAWLFGETICPVGMHTKDKSKAAAALLVKPLKKVSEIMREKSEEDSKRSESVFFDHDDDFEEFGDQVDEQSSFSLNLQKLKSSDSSMTLPYAKATENKFGFGAFDKMALLGYSLFECIFKEILQVVSDSIVRDSSESLNNSFQITLQKAIDLVSFISSTPHQRLLAPFFTRVAIFQSGIITKVISGGFLSKFRETLFTISHDFGPIMRLLDRFKIVIEQYSTVIQRCLKDTLLPSTLNQIVAKITTTVNRCGVTQIAHDLVEFISKQNDLKYELFELFLNFKRFGEKNSQLRRILTYLFQSASKKACFKFKCLFEDALCQWIKIQLKSIPMPLHSNSYKINDNLWAMPLIKSLLTMFEKAQSIAKVEMFHSNLCHLSAERAFQEVFNYSEDSIWKYGIAKAFAIIINALLSNSQYLDNIDIHLGQWNRVGFLESVQSFFKIILDEEIFSYFEHFYENILTFRLLERNYSSLSNDLTVLKSFPIMKRAQHMIQDLEQQSVLLNDFSKYLLRRLDNDEIEYNPMIGLALRSRNITFDVISSSTWSHLTKITSIYADLILPSQMSMIWKEFDNYYTKTTTETDSSNGGFSGPFSHDLGSDVDTLYRSNHNATGTRKLYPCYGVGLVTLGCKLDDDTVIDVIVNEPQAVLLLSFNKKKTFSVSELSQISGLPIESMQSVLLSLTSNETPILERKSLLSPNQIFSLSDQVTLSRRLLSGQLKFVDESSDDYVPIAVTNSVHFVNSKHKYDQIIEWKWKRIDACVVKVLKNAMRDKSGGLLLRSSKMIDTALMSDELVSRVYQGLRPKGRINNSSNEIIYSQDILARCDYLASIGFIDKLKSFSGTVSVCGYSYLDISVENSPEAICGIKSQTVSKGKELFEQMRSLLLQSSDPYHNKNNSGDVGEGNDYSYSESKENLFITKQQFCTSFIEWIIRNPVSDQSANAQFSQHSNPIEVEPKFPEHIKAVTFKDDGKLITSPFGSNSNLCAFIEGGESYPFSPSTKLPSLNSKTKSDQKAVIDLPSNQIVLHNGDISPSSYGLSSRENRLAFKRYLYLAIVEIVSQTNKLVYQHGVEFQEKFIEDLPSIHTFESAVKTAMYRDIAGIESLKLSNDSIGYNTDMEIALGWFLLLPTSSLKMIHKTYVSFLSEIIVSTELTKLKAFEQDFDERNFKNIITTLWKQTFRIDRSKLEQFASSTLSAEYLVYFSNYLDDDVINEDGNYDITLNKIEMDEKDDNFHLKNIDMCGSDYFNINSAMHVNLHIFVSSINEFVINQTNTPKHLVNDPHDPTNFDFKIKSNAFEVNSDMQAYSFITPSFNIDSFTGTTISNSKERLVTPTKLDKKKSRMKNYFKALNSNKHNSREKSESKFSTTSLPSSGMGFSFPSTVTAAPQLASSSSLSTTVLTSDNRHPHFALDSNPLFGTDFLSSIPNFGNRNVSKVIADDKDDQSVLLNLSSIPDSTPSAKLPNVRTSLSTPTENACNAMIGNDSPPIRNSIHESYSNIASQNKHTSLLKMARCQLEQLYYSLSSFFDERPTDFDSDESKILVSPHLQQCSSENSMKVYISDDENELAARIPSSSPDDKAEDKDIYTSNKPHNQSPLQIQEEVKLNVSDAQLLDVLIHILDSITINVAKYDKWNDVSPTASDEAMSFQSGIDTSGLIWMQGLAVTQHADIIRGPNSSNPARHSLQNILSCAFSLMDMNQDNQLCESDFTCSSKINSSVNKNKITNCDFEYENIEDHLNGIEDEDENSIEDVLHISHSTYQNMNKSKNKKSFHIMLSRLCNIIQKPWYEFIHLLQEYYWDEHTFLEFYFSSKTSNISLGHINGTANISSFQCLNDFPFVNSKCFQGKKSSSGGNEIQMDFVEYLTGKSGKEAYLKPKLRFFESMYYNSSISFSNKNKNTINNSISSNESSCKFCHIFNNNLINNQRKYDNNKLNLDSFILKNPFTYSSSIISNKCSAFGTNIDSIKNNPTNNILLLPVFISNPLKYKSIFTTHQETIKLGLCKLEEYKSLLSHAEQYSLYVYYRNIISIWSYVLYASDLIDHYNIYSYHDNNNNNNNSNNNNLLELDAIDHLIDILSIVRVKLKNRWNSPDNFTNDIANKYLFGFKKIIQRVFNGLTPKFVIKYDNNYQNNNDSSYSMLSLIYECLGIVFDKLPVMLLSDQRNLSHEDMIMIYRILSKSMIHFINNISDHNKFDTFLISSGYRSLIQLFKQENEDIHKLSSLLMIINRIVRIVHNYYDNNNNNNNNNVWDGIIDELIELIQNKTMILTEIMNEKPSNANDSKSKYRILLSSFGHLVNHTEEIKNRNYNNNNNNNNNNVLNDDNNNDASSENDNILNQNIDLQLEQFHAMTDY
eukprot:gene4848-6795_t